MDSNLQKVAEMIKKTFHKKEQVDCFDGCVLYVNEHCIGVRAACVKEIGDKFINIKSLLDDISKDVKSIKDDLGLNGSNKG